MRRAWGLWLGVWRALACFVLRAQQALVDQLDARSALCSAEARGRACPCSSVQAVLHIIIVVGPILRWEPVLVACRLSTRTAGGLPVPLNCTKVPT